LGVSLRPSAPSLASDGNAELPVVVFLMLIVLRGKRLQQRLDLSHVVAMIWYHQMAHRNIWTGRDQIENIVERLYDNYREKVIFGGQTSVEKESGRRTAKRRSSSGTSRTTERTELPLSYQ
jgi:hypothetical protein